MFKSLYGGRSSLFGKRVQYYKPHAKKGTLSYGVFTREKREVEFFKIKKESFKQCTFHSWLNKNFLKKTFVKNKYSKNLYSLVNLFRTLMFPV